MDAIFNFVHNRYRKFVNSFDISYSFRINLLFHQRVRHQRRYMAIIALDVQPCFSKSQPANKAATH